MTLFSILKKYFYTWGQKIHFIYTCKQCIWMDNLKTSKHFQMEIPGSVKQVSVLWVLNEPINNCGGVED